MERSAVMFDTECFKTYIYQVIKSAYTMGLVYAKTKPSFSEEEAIQRFQDAHWEDLKKLEIIKEGF